MMNSEPFAAKDVLELYKAIQKMQITIWLDGGWGVDALLGEQTREHLDLDLVIQEKDLNKFCNFLRAQGYAEISRDDSCAWNFVLADQLGRQVDVHVIHFDTDGNGIYGPPEHGIFYPATALLCIGEIAGCAVKCLTPEYQVQSHLGYELKEKDFKDVFALCRKFDILLPTEYQEWLDHHHT